METDINAVTTESPLLKLEAYGLTEKMGDFPFFDFGWKQIGKKRRLISYPNKAMRKLHTMFGNHLAEKIDALGKDESYNIRMLPSSAGCVKKSSPMKNALAHSSGEFFYITDFSKAYESVDLERLAVLLHFIIYYENYRSVYSITKFTRNDLIKSAVENDPLFEKTFSFVKMAFGGIRGEGLAFGGPLSPFLLNVYCEVYLDSRIREYLRTTVDKRHPEKTIVYTRYVDDLVFSRGVFMPSFIRQRIRQYVEEAGFKINHKKSRYLERKKGVIFVTKIGITVEKESENALVFSRKKRRRLEGIIQSYIKPIPIHGGLSLPGYWHDNPEQVLGIAGEFVNHYKNTPTPTKSDERTMSLFKQFLKIAGPYFLRRKTLDFKERKILRSGLPRR